MFEYNDPSEKRKNCFDRSPQFWDRFVKSLFLGGLSIVLLALVFKWLGYFG